MVEEAGMFVVNRTMGQVGCCKCGILMSPNAANMCVTCLRSEIDITENLPRHDIVMHCPECERYLEPPRKWLSAELESAALLKILINRIKPKLKAKNYVILKHADFVWTEPHSKRIKLKLTVQKEVFHGALLEQSYIVEYVVQDQMCKPCSRIHANPDQWVAVVQLRQHVPHRRTFFYLEQLILKHDAAARTIRIGQMDQGIDFFFDNKSHAEEFIEFVKKFAPIQSRASKELVSHDSKSNISNIRYTFSVEICPICHEDLICLPPKVAASLGNLGPIVICTKVTKNVILLDPVTLRQSFFDAVKYFRSPFKALLSTRRLVEYIVLDVEVDTSESNVDNSKYTLADAQVARVSDFGKNDTIFSVRTHLGHLLKPGDYALGYDLCEANGNMIELDKYKKLVIPEVILIKKSYEEKRRKKRGKPRPWKLKSLSMEIVDSKGGRGDQEMLNAGLEEFMNDLEEIPEMRHNVSLYTNREYQPSDSEVMTDDEDVPAVKLEELLADLDLSDNEDGNDDQA